MRHISDACQVNFSLLNSVQAGIILKVISYYLLPAIELVWSILRENNIWDLKRKPKPQKALFYPSLQIDSEYLNSGR